MRVVMRTDAPTIAGLALTWREFASADALHSFGIWTLADPDAPLDLLTDEEFQSTDERMPYFGHIWPAAEALVEYILSGPDLRGRRVLDLGCGLGPCGFAAHTRGADVTFFDWEPRALEIVAKTARALRSQDRVHMAVGDWRNPPSFGLFELILAADVLYEARNAPAVAEFLAGHLDGQGEAWVADPGRLHAKSFPDLVEAGGLLVHGTERLPHPDPAAAITCWRLARALRPASP
jgi:predicted nicotinamide N-methyase